LARHLTNSKFREVIYTAQKVCLALRRTVTTAKIEANRMNSKRSTGPRTQGGKRNSRFNALTLGLFAKHVVIPICDGYKAEKDFQLLLDGLHKEFEPVGLYEEWLVARVAESMWRLRRATRCESGSVRESAAPWEEHRPWEDREENLRLLDLQINIWAVTDAEQQLRDCGTLSQKTFDRVSPLVEEEQRKTIQSDKSVKPDNPQKFLAQLTNLKASLESTHGAQSRAPPNTNSSYTFYWAYPASSVQATYQYTMAGGGSSASSPVATATFNITGPSGGSMRSTAITTLHIANLSACTGHPGGPFLIFAAGATGSLCSLVVTTPGITFNSPTGYSNTSGGNFLVGQLVSHDTLTGGGTTYGPGLDGSWPYGDGTLPTNDSPAIYLASTYRTLTRSFEATMFLMWQSTTSNSIPAPLGYQTWKFSATASCSASCGTTSNWSVSSSSAGLEGVFTASSSSQRPVGQNTLKYGYPTWTSVSY
jgi:hypothetical protein